MRFFWLEDFLYFCSTTVLLLYYYCTTSVLLPAQYQASDVVDCGGECRLEAKVFKMKGFLVLVVILE